jgi:hypothetical protein
VPYPTARKITKQESSTSGTAMTGTITRAAARPASIRASRSGMPVSVWIGAPILVIMAFSPASAFRTAGSLSTARAPGPA